MKKLPRKTLGPSGIRRCLFIEPRADMLKKKKVCLMCEVGRVGVYEDWGHLICTKGSNLKTEAFT